MSEMSQLFFFSNISPHVAKLLGLISSVNIIEGGELGTKEVSEMSDFNISKVESKKIFVMPDHTSDPFIVRPSSKSCNTVDCANVEEDKEKTSSAS